MTIDTDYDIGDYILYKKGSVNIAGTVEQILIDVNKIYYIMHITSDKIDENDVVNELEVLIT